MVPRGAAQDTSNPVAEGTITRLVPPSSFEVNGHLVTLQHGVKFDFMGIDSGRPIEHPTQYIRVGAYVQVMGVHDLGASFVKAETVLLRDDWDRNISGLSVIDQVVSAGPEPVFEADGYRIRVPASVTPTFQQDLKTLADVGANTWIRYKGKLEGNGELLASKVTFIPAKPTKFKALKGVEIVDTKFEAPGTAANNHAASAPGTPGREAASSNTASAEDGRVMLGLRGKWHRIPADPALQTRIGRVGMSVVPAYQKALADDHPSKIQFRFYAVDAEKIQTPICFPNGLILIPMQVVERLGSDDRLAAVLAEAVAWNLQRQMARVIADNRVLLGAEFATDVAGAIIPGVGLANLVGAGAAHKINEEMEEQRGRVALALMSDAGYDPEEAPEAWRILASKRNAKSKDPLIYPDHSCYLLQVLNLQYRTHATASGTSAGAAAGANR